MYAHQVIEDLISLKTNSAANPAVIDKVISKICNAKHFHFSTAEKVISVLNIEKGYTLFLDKQGEFITPPYSTCWFDFDVKTNQRMSKIGYIFYQVHPKWIVSLYFERNNRVGKWVPFPYSFFIGLGCTTNECEFEEIKKITELRELKSRISGNLIASNHLRVYSKEVSDKETYAISKEGASMNGPLNFGLMLINCRNVETALNNPSKNLNKKRQKSGRPELFQYHTLQLTLPGKRNEYYTETDLKELSKIEKRLHFCRGHFKSYTDENPLFGKYTGRFWWHPQIKGNKAKGFVLKDYSIKSKEG